MAHQIGTGSRGQIPCFDPCRLCGAQLRHVFVDLGMSPLCESFVEPEALDQGEIHYPLRVMTCEACFLVQLKAYVAPDKIFRDYAYFSSYSSSWVAHARRYCEAAAARLDLGPHSQVVEIASNDGYLLQHFLPLGVPVLGVEPAANVAQVAIDSGIETRVEFFGVALARRLVAEGRQADLIIGNNVLAQVPDLNDFVAGLAILLKPDGVITLEFPHLARLIGEAQFDTIYHEHFSYFSLLAIEQIAARHRLRLVDVEEIPTHGGSLRVHLAHAASRSRPRPAVSALLAAERGLGLDRVETYAGFGEQVRATKRALLSLLIALKDRGSRICGYGAPGKGNTLLNYCGIGTDFLDFTVDRNPHKHGRYTPGMHVPILPPEALDMARPDYVLILPWNLKDEIMEQMGHIADWGGRFIVPIPRPRIVDPRDIAPSREMAS
ncbi:MAG: SAM-dependent methyltransferase [Kaistia sp. SCN 65-12]|nr:MAG: SAM-dependent methyltransferase [Kaistia sp. SCN 65-12]